MNVNIEFNPGQDGDSRGVEIANASRFEVTLRRKRMYFRVYCEGGNTRTYDYAEIKRVTVESADGTKQFDLLPKGGN